MATALAPEPVSAAPKEERALQRLDTALAQPRAGHPKLVGPSGEEMPLPPSVYTLMRRIVHQLARGAAVAVVPYEALLTTQQAADLLDISRPSFIRLLEEKTLPYRKVGTHRRVAFKDVLAYREREEQRRRAVLAEMIERTEKAGLYDAELGREADLQARRKK